MSLSGQQRQELQLALIDAFPNTASLEQMLSFGLDKNLRAIAGEGSLQDIVFKLIQTANSQGWVEDLVRAAFDSNPGNPLLKAIAEELLSNHYLETHKVSSPNIPQKQSNQPQKILILAAIPHGLRLDKEIREIEEAIRRATNRDLFEIRIRTAVRPQDIRRAIAEEQPQIVHFCGHGLEDGSLLLEDDGGNNKPVAPSGLASLFKLHADYVKCVLLNACYSEKPAVAISKYINYVIGMNNPIQDRAAIEFARGFYDGLGYKNLANQDAFQRAFDEAIVAIEMENLSQGVIPVLKKKETRVELKPPFWIIQRLQNPKFTSSLLLDRSKEIKKIVSYLLNSQLRNIVVLQGAGGFGKSVLALLTCCEPEILQHFTGGIFWIDLGEGKNVLEGMRKLYKQLTNLDCPSHLDEEDTIIELMKKWKNKPCLLVLNDVQKKEDFRKFYINLQYCSWLVTTRIHNVVDKAISISINIKPLRPEESTLLIKYDLSEKGEFNEEKLRELADQLYEWPLLINLIRNKINELIENNTSDEVLDKIITRLKIQGWIRYFGDEISENLKISFDSLKEDEKEFFEELIIFPENLSIPLLILEKIWELNDISVEDLCQKLYNLSLLENFENCHIRLNSYLRQYLRQINELKENLPVIHNKLLKSYENKYQIKLTEELTEEFLNLLSNEEKTYFKRFYKYHWRRAKLI
ncbi:effector-associated domain EAD1-containing protein [Nostoc sp. LEGE 12450]|uniref:effector-associated domain EAD1-containing protein n=1 Tax=Nostoc sp. LEGE 12450 TaxID=1828643 RepID=UPI00187E3D46|nr:effector-associated domain EAD1-containing protein [Nostoc sp. LEGE 12450]MBE8990044.1 CHAT domain-containing protein [Nostoc sp. LEGE 12450]